MARMDEDVYKSEKIMTCIRGIYPTVIEKKDINEPQVSMVLAPLPILTVTRNSKSAGVDGAVGPWLGHYCVQEGQGEARIPGACHADIGQGIADYFPWPFAHLPWLLTASDCFEVPDFERRVDIMEAVAELPSLLDDLPKLVAKVSATFSTPKP